MKLSKRAFAVGMARDWELKLDHYMDKLELIPGGSQIRR